MRKIIAVFVVLFISAGFASGSFAKEDATVACKKQAEEKKITGQKAARFIYDCVKKAKK